MEAKAASTTYVLCQTCLGKGKLSTLCRVHKRKLAVEIITDSDPINGSIPAGNAEATPCRPTQPTEEGTGSEEAPSTSRPSKIPRTDENSVAQGTKEDVEQGLKDFDAELAAITACMAAIHGEPIKREPQSADTTTYPGMGCYTPTGVDPEVHNIPKFIENQPPQEVHRPVATVAPAAKASQPEGTERQQQRENHRPVSTVTPAATQAPQQTETTENTPRYEAVRAPIMGLNEFGLLAIWLSFRGLTVHAVVNTGAVCSLMSPDLAHLIRAKISLAQPPASIIHGDGRTVTLDRYAIVPVAVGTTAMIHKFWLAEPVTSPVLVGTDFLNTIKAQVKIGEFVLSYGQ